MRPDAGVAVVALHVGIGAAMGLHHHDWMFMAPGLGFVRRIERQ